MPLESPTQPLLAESLRPVDQIGGPSPQPSGAMCCGEPIAACPCPAPTARPSWVMGDAEGIPRVATRLSWRDTLDAWRARWGIGRMALQVPPGLYAAGGPTPHSPVLVTANYKLSFDGVRGALGDLDAWILVLDTRGINVWCAAGKGTFGTQELVARIESTGLAARVTHRTLVLPQLGGPGVAAHEVKRLSGFRVKWGPVRASDLPAFLREGGCTPAMRAAAFGFRDRLVLTPVELVNLKPMAIRIAALLFLLQLPGWMVLRPSDLWPFLGAVLAGTVLTPALLPWIPGRAFALKGALMGLAWAAIAMHGLPPSPAGVLTGLSYLLLFPALSAYLALQFTGSSTFTSLSGVIRETRATLPLARTAGAAGLLCWGLARWLG